MIRQSPESKRWFRRVPAKRTSMSAVRNPTRMFRPGKEQARPVVAGVIVQPGVSSRAPEVQRSSKVQVSRDIGKMMGIPPLPGRDISSSTSKASNISKASKMNSVSQSCGSKK
jgi:hypothetical protein